MIAELGSEDGHVPHSQAVASSYQSCPSGRPGTLSPKRSVIPSNANATITRPRPRSHAHLRRSSDRRGRPLRTRAGAKEKGRARQRSKGKEKAKGRIELAEVVVVVVVGGVGDVQQLLIGHVGIARALPAARIRHAIPWRHRRPGGQGDVDAVSSPERQS